MFNQSHYIRYGLEKIPFEIRPRTGSIYRVLVKIHADCRVIVHAPPSASKAEIFHAVNKRARWIHQKYSQFKAQLEHVAPRYYVSGESHYYLGKKYLLKVIENPEADPYVKLLHGKLEINVKGKRDIKLILQNWYKEKAKEFFNHRLDTILPQTLWLTERPQIRIRNMQNQWGSCSPSGRLTLNPHLIKAPRECIDYVILHELCHIAEHNHSDKFYRLMRQIMPNWEKVKAKLDGMANVLLNED